MAQVAAEGARSVAGIDVDQKYYAELKELAEADALVVGASTYYHEKRITDKTSAG